MAKGIREKAVRPFGSSPSGQVLRARSKAVDSSEIGISSVTLGPSHPASLAESLAARSICSFSRTAAKWARQGEELFATSSPISSSVRLRLDGDPLSKAWAIRIWRGMQVAVFEAPQARLDGAARDGLNSSGKRMSMVR